MKHAFAWKPNKSVCVCVICEQEYVAFIVQTTFSN